MMTQDGVLQPTQGHHEDSSILRWGGLAGIGGSVLLVLVFMIVGIFAGPELAVPQARSHGSRRSEWRVRSRTACT